MGELRTSKNSTCKQAGHLSPSTSIATTISSNPSAFSMLLTWHKPSLVGGKKTTNPQLTRFVSPIGSEVMWCGWLIIFVYRCFLIFRFLKVGGPVKKTRPSPFWLVKVQVCQIVVSGKGLKFQTLRGFRQVCCIRLFR